jgi:hypothetical protein
VQLFETFGPARPDLGCHDFGDRADVATWCSETTAGSISLRR